MEKTKNAHFTLPFQFDVEKLKGDLAKCQAFDFLPNYIKENYQGDKYILPLRSIHGELNRVAALPNSTHLYQNTKALNACPYFQEVIQTFECVKESIRLMNLAAGKHINEHTDDGSGYEDGYFRIHVPIITNEEVIFTLNGEDLKMQAGSAWYANINLPHSVQNKGKSDRIHLVIDCLRNDWSDKLFAKMGYDFEYEKVKNETEYSEETLKLIIANLEAQNTKETAAIAQEMRQKHQL